MTLHRQMAGFSAQRPPHCGLRVKSTGFRTGPIVLTACIALSVVCVHASVFTHIDHDCAGGDCLVCLQIEAAKNLLKGLALISIIALYRTVHAQIDISTTKPFFIDLPTPITLKVKSTT